MKTVTAFVHGLIAKQVEDHRLVVWYDPERAYKEVVAELAPPGTTVSQYDGSFFQLRKEIDHLMNDGQPPRLVIYVPIEREKTHAALIELDSAGVVMQPRQQPPACNTRLSVVARNALKPILGEDQVGEIERQVEAGKLSLADLNSLADKGKDISTGVLTLIFGSANPQEVGLAFLHDDQHDDEIAEKEAGRMEAILSFEHGNRVVDLTEVGEAQVSTVFIGLDHGLLRVPGQPPVLFETMIFGGPHDHRQWRCSTLGQAKRGHWAIVEALRNGESPQPPEVEETGWVWNMFYDMIENMIEDMREDDDGSL